MNQGGGLTRLILALVAGLILGVLLGAWLFYSGPLKVEFTGAHSYDLLPDEKEKYVTLVADSYALDRDRDRAASYLVGSAWNLDEIQESIEDAALQYEAEGRPDVVQRLRDLQLVMGLEPGAPPAQVTPPAGATATPEPVAPEGGASSVLDRIRTFCATFIVVMLALIGGYVLYRWLRQRRAAAPARPASSAATTGRISPAPTTMPIGPAEEWKGVGQPPLGHFITTYKLGEDTYDESFSIETPAGEFLGECGMGISETIGKGDPDQVTAFEVWLFDKSDIRTVTKVLMSDHAYHDEALRGKLAAKGEAVLAQVGTPFPLETTGLQVQVTVTDLSYGEGPLPPKSFFRQLTVELVALARPGSAA